VIEGEVTSVDPAKKTIRFTDNSEIKGAVSTSEISYDHCVYGIGATNQTFGIPGVHENACFLKVSNRWLPGFCVRLAREGTSAS